MSDVHSQNFLKDPASLGWTDVTFSSRSTGFVSVTSTLLSFCQVHTCAEADKQATFQSLLQPVLIIAPVFNMLLVVSWPSPADSSSASQPFYEPARLNSFLFALRQTKRSLRSMLLAARPHLGQQQLIVSTWLERSTWVLSPAARSLWVQLYTKHMTISGTVRHGKLFYDLKV